MENNTKTPRVPYQAPQVQTLTTSQVLEALGPASAIYGEMPHNDDSLWG
jgi:hypothetical protein